MAKTKTSKLGSKRTLETSPVQKPDEIKQRIS